jgi:hypothetical protein
VSLLRLETPHKARDFGLSCGKVAADQSVFEFENIPAASASGVTEPPPGYRVHCEVVILAAMDRTRLRIPTKKITHSELKTIRSSPSDAGKSIVERVIVMGQGKVRY